MKKLNYAITSTLLTFFLTGCSYNNTLFTHQQPIAPNTTVNVNISGGTAYSPKSKSNQNFMPISFTLKSGNCNKMTLSLADNTATTLKSCYRNGVLVLDSEKAVRINFISLWQQGFTYPNISTNGKARLNNVNVKVMLVNTTTA